MCNRLVGDELGPGDGDSPGASEDDDVDGDDGDDGDGGAAVDPIVRAPPPPWPCDGAVAANDTTSTSIALLICGRGGAIGIAGSRNGRGSSELASTSQIAAPA
jgi:hypothetical protein